VVAWAVATHVEWSSRRGCEVSGRRVVPAAWPAAGFHAVGCGWMCAGRCRRTWWLPWGWMRVSP